MTLQIGKTYKSRDGLMFECVSEYRIKRLHGVDTFLCKIKGTSIHYEHNSYGEWVGGEGKDSLDLILEIKYRRYK